MKKIIEILIKMDLAALISQQRINEAQQYLMQLDEVLSDAGLIELNVYDCNKLARKQCRKYGDEVFENYTVAGIERITQIVQSMAVS